MKIFSSSPYSSNYPKPHFSARTPSPTASFVSAVQQKMREGFEYEDAELMVKEDRQFFSSQPSNNASQSVAQLPESSSSSQQGPFNYDLGGYQDYLSDAGRPENSKNKKEYTAAINRRTDRRRTAVRRAMPDSEKQQIQDAVKQTDQYSNANGRVKKKRLIDNATKRRLNEIIAKVFDTKISKRSLKK
jgi:hypothetical protein